MNDRHITAVVLLSGATSGSTLEALRQSLDAQSRTPDQIVVVAPSDLADAPRDQLEQDLAAARIDRLLPVSASLSRAGAVREILDSFARTQDGESAPEPGADRATQPGAQTARPGGRRARDVDSAAVERERTQQAEDLARIPQRLRRQAPRPGRRAGSGRQEGETWLWFLIDGAPPAADALARQVDMIEASPNTAAVGAKRVRHREDPDPHGTDPVTVEGADALVDVGLTLTHGGRIITGVDPGEIDQGQADWRHDVLAVPLPGMLVREQTLREIGGLDPDLPAPWAEIDLCRRIWRAGERVAVQSAARVLHPAPTRPLLERLREQRTGQLLVLLKQRSLLHALLTLLLLPAETLLRCLGAIAASAPRPALMELRAASAVLPRARRVLARGMRERRQARVPRGRLAPLYLPRADALRRGFEQTWIGLFADDDRQRQIRRTTWGIAGTRHGVDDADYGRHIVWTGVVALSGAVLGLLTLRGLFGRGELTGPGLIPLPEDRADLWQGAWSSWIPAGLGESGPGDALLRLLGLLPAGGQLPIELLVFAAVPLSALCAWWAAGALTRAVGARLAIATVWALAPPLLTALEVGAWPLLAVHILLPLLALSVGRAIGLPHKVSQASVSAAAAAGLLLMVIGAVQPVLVVLGTAGLALIAIAAPGRRRRLLWVLLPSLALHAPFVPGYIGHPGTLLAVAGVPSSAGSASTLQLLALWPAAPGMEQVLAPLLGTTVAASVPLLLPVAPVVLAALLAPLLPGAAGRVGRFGLLLAALGLLTLLLARGVRTAVDGEELATAQPGALLSVVLLALSIGACAGFDALARREAGDGRGRRIVTAATGVVVAAACVVSVAGWTVLLPGQLSLQRAEGGEVPAAAADQGRTDARSRVLVLSEQSDGAVEAELVVHGGDTVLQHAAIADARAVDAARAGEPVDGDPASEALRGAVAGMLSSAAPSGEESRAAAARLAIAYVVVRGDLDEQSELRGALDSSTELEKVTEGTRGGMWRVIDAAPRAAVRGGSAPVPLASGTIEAHGTVPAEETARTVVLAERFDPQWRATLDGTELESVEVDGWAQGFTLPSGAGGDVDVHREQPLRLLWQLLLYGTIALTAVISIPWRVRSRSVEAMYG